MSRPQQPQDNQLSKSQDRFLHLKVIDVDFAGTRPRSALEIKFNKESGIKHESEVFKKTDPLRWECDIYINVLTLAKAVLTVQKAMAYERNRSVVELRLEEIDAAKFGDDRTVEHKDSRSDVNVKMVFGESKLSSEVARLLADRAVCALATKVSMLDNLDQVFSFLKLVSDLGGPAGELNTAAKITVASVTTAIKKFQEISACHRELVSIMDDVASSLPTMERALKHVTDDDVHRNIRRFLDLVHKVSQELIEYASRSAFGLVLRSWYKSKREYVNTLRNDVLNLKSNLNSALLTAIHLHQLSDDDKKELQSLKPAELSAFDPDHCCLAGTRASVLQRVEKWAVSDDEASRIYWVHGVAGCGKSSVAASVASALDSQKVASGSFFCKRDIPERRNPSRLVRGLAYLLARACKPFSDALLRVLKGDPTTLDKALKGQFDALIADRLSEVSKSDQPERVVIIVDALDECENNEIISSFLAQMAGLAPWLRLIVTSRPLPHIEKALSGELMRHHDLFKEDTYQDILSFIRSRFGPEGSLADIRSEISDSEIEALAKKTGGLFIWIATVLEHVGLQDIGRVSVLKQILYSSSSGFNPEEKLDVVYRKVLQDASPNKDVISMIIGLVFVISRNRPLPSKTLHAFFPSKPGVEVRLSEVDAVVKKLGSVLTTDSRTDAIRACHPSFLDFIGTQTRSGEFWTETEKLDAIMRKKCFDIMEAGLKFNICELESSYLPNVDVAGLEERVARCVPRELQYSCFYWLDHLSKSEDRYKREVGEMLDSFLSGTKSLYWLEVLSLMSELKVANAILQKFQSVYKDDTKLCNAALDIYRFVTGLHEPMSTSTPHIYASALLWAPSESMIAKSHGSKFKSSQQILSGRNANWPVSLRTLSTESMTNCVQYSSDGRRIISGSDDNTIRIWDAESGAPIGEPLRGHTDRVNSVGYSPDGRRIISGSCDETIRMWDAESGAPVGEPLRGHTGWVNSVGYSPDGRRIISGSGDKTIQMWDAESGAPVGEPLRGHTGGVNSVGYSPDGSRIISGSEDKMIRMWDAESGATVGEPLRGHTGWVLFVGYSPDGSRIVSGSYDETIRVWDAESGAPVGEPLRGHTGWGNSVGYSPDGTRIISGSSDKTIRVWDAESGAPIGEPLQGHTRGVNSVGYSPDGSRIISGSFDKTIRVWDSESGAPVGEPLRGHTGGVLSVGYSPDGRRIISGSFDNTIQMWDAESGAPIGEPLRGHTGWVNSVGYSPDGSRIISGSEDKTIRMWDAENGATVGEPLRGHTGGVLFVGYSANGSRIISGSFDKTIRVWDAESGAPVGEPLRGHTNFVFSVGYSPDGSRIISGSSDNTIRMWDAESGGPVGEPLRGHTRGVNSVGYSPDGSRFISVSSDKTIRMWDAESGGPVGEPLRGHTGPVWSVGYSPDGSRIVSGSYDETIRVWDAESGAPVGEPLRGHTGWVNSVGYSPDGSRIISGSSDKTIRVWDAESGAPIGEPLRGYTDLVSSVGYSPDGRRVISGSRNNRIRVWDAHCATSVGELSQGGSRWSPDDECFVSISESNASDEETRVVYSTIPLSIPLDGWIRTLDGGLLLWVPHEYRHGVCDMSLACMPYNADGHPVKIDWKSLYRAWTDLRNEEKA